jgi:hypothetical protein
MGFSVRTLTCDFRSKQTTAGIVGDTGRSNIFVQEVIKDCGDRERHAPCRRCSAVFGGGFHDRDAVEKRAGLVGGEDRRLALFDDVFWAAHGMGRIDVDHMPGDEPVEQHAERGQVLLDGRRRHLGLQVLNESGNMERLDDGKLVEVSLSAPGAEAPGGVHIGPAGMIVVDLVGKNYRTRFAAFGVGAKNGAGWRSGEGARMISVVKRWISATFYWSPARSSRV